MTAFTTDLIRTLQERLADLGYYTGKLDGVPGPLTSAAVSAYKAANGMAARDYPGPVTMTALWSPDAKPKAPVTAIGRDPAWMVEAKRLIGTREVAGAGDSPIIMKWAKDMDQWYPDDATPWCGLFVAHCMRIGAPGVPQVFNRLGAREWLKFGEDCAPGYGAIAVFSRPGSSWAGHVGFIVGADADTWHILGGNQSDMVNVTRVSKSRALGYRCPPHFTPDTKLNPVTTGDLSVNEA